VFRTVFYLIRDGPFIRHISASLSILFSGIGIAAFAGFAIGLLLYRYKLFKAAAYPVIECVRGIAALTLFPLLIVLFGLGASARIFVIFWTAWPAVVLSTLNSLDVDKCVVDAARTAGAGDWRIIFSIRIPMAARGILTGLRIGAGGGWISLIAAEMLGAQKGIGFFLLWSSQSFQYERVYASIVIIALIGGAVNFILLLLQEALFQATGD
jgi:ABC-type nitrate/sulfonate/bicarbonate transport system permease component